MRDAADTQLRAEIASGAGYEVEQLRLGPGFGNGSDRKTRLGVLNPQVKTNQVTRLVTHAQVRAQHHKISAQILTDSRQCVRR